MIAKRTLVFLALLAASFSARAGESVTIDVPPPSSGYTAEHPAYLYFKQIVITRKAKSMYEFHLTLQGNLPPRYDKESGVRFKTYFDFQGIKSEKPEKKVGNAFADDMIISVFHNGGGLKYEVWTSLQAVGSKVYELDVTGLKVTKDEISFTARCPIFTEEIPTKVLFSSGFLKREGKSLMNQDIGGGQDTKPTGLNNESNAAFAAATPTPAPTATPSADSSKDPSLNSLIKP
ncbi:hypothetical protein BH09VER1_BH09VER1_50480 [soil metagenome]